MMDPVERGNRKDGKLGFRVGQKRISEEHGWSLKKLQETFNNSNDKTWSNMKFHIFQAIF